MKQLTDGHLQALLNVLFAEAAVSRHAVSALIATHPEPDILRLVWQQSMPTWIEQIDEVNLLKSGDFREQYTHTLGNLSQEIDEAVERFLQQPQPPTPRAP
jgi:hypothetical protein